MTSQYHHQGIGGGIGQFWHGICTLKGSLPTHESIVRGTVLVVCGASAYAMLNSWARRRRGGGKNVRKEETQRISNSDAEAIEIRAGVDRLLSWQFGRCEDIVSPELDKYFEKTDTVGNDDNILQDALSFFEKLGILAEQHCDALKDFTGESEPPMALDLCCGVGRGAFELAKSFPIVWGCDSSQLYINAAKTLAERGWIRYNSPEMGDFVSEHTAIVPNDVDRDRVRFIKGDPLDLPRNVRRAFDAVMLINCLCRLEDPRKMLLDLHRLVRVGGVLVLATPFDWDEMYTPRSKWLGNHNSKQGNTILAKKDFSDLLEKDFSLLKEQDLPYLIRHHARRYILGISYVTVWVRK